MIRSDFVNSGFPVNRHCPVLYFNRDKDVLVLCHNRFDLRAALEKNGTKSAICVGMWPGKRDTDGFMLDPEKYITVPVPPEEHKDIDSSEEISVTFNADFAFASLSYRAGIMIYSTDKKLYDYVLAAGLKFNSIKG